jgi:formylglycine-generating enzyme required for sulfatase activity
LRGFACVVAPSAVAACSDIGSPRAQLLVVVDTDAHVVGELATRDDVSPDATMDTLRVDFLDAADGIYASQTFIDVANTSAWPVSLGVVPAEAGAPSVRIRLRLFRGSLASTDSVNGTPTLTPLPQIAVDRLIEVAVPTSAEESATVTLAEDCMGVAVTLGAHPSTCVSATAPAAEPTAGVAVTPGVSTPRSAVGTWSAGIYSPCSADAGPEQVCIPGGFAILGDVRATDRDSPPDVNPVPLRPVVVSPFFLDRCEFTVSRLQQLVGHGFAATLPSMASDPSVEDASYCTWGVSGDEALPVNCIGLASAAAACHASGGELPTEAQWEYAARGRGERLDYPWGNVPPQCCSANLGVPEPNYLPDCSGEGPLPVGSFPVTAACGETGDMTRDGVSDMAGNVMEALADTFAGYSSPCWSSLNILHDPVCASGDQRSVRGAYWNLSLTAAFLALRQVWDGTPNIAVGFRCAYPASSP